MTIYFKNGLIKFVPSSIGEIIKSRLLSAQGSPKFQVFSDEHDQLLYIINIDEIVFTD